jgi:RPA family protein
MEEEKQTTNQTSQEKTQQPTQPSTQPRTQIRTDIKRRTAYRLFIGMILQGRPELRNQRLLYSMINNKETTRVNIIGNIIDKFVSEQKPYCALTIDDGTGTIRIKAFADSVNMLQKFEQGDSINVIGKLSHFNNEIYILPEIVKESGITWLIARKLELEKEFGKDITKILSDQQREEQIAKHQEEKNPYQPTQKPEESKQKQIEPAESEPIKEEKIEIEKEEKENKSSEEKAENSTKSEILEKIKESEPDGIDIDKIIMSMNKPVEEINNTITALLESGDVYEPKPGRLRIL